MTSYVSTFIFYSVTSLFKYSCCLVGAEAILITGPYPAVNHVLLGPVAVLYSSGSSVRTGPCFFFFFLGAKVSPKEIINIHEFYFEITLKDS